MDKNAKSFLNISLALLAVALVTFSVYSVFVLADLATVSIVYPANSALYNYAITELNFSAQFADSCTYSVNGGITNLSAAGCNNLTGLSSAEGTNVWLVNAINDTDGNSTAFVTFMMDTLQPVAGVTTAVNSTNVYGTWLGCSAENINITARFADNVSGINSTSCRWKDRSGDSEGQWHSNNVTWNGNSTDGYCVAITGTSTAEQAYNLNLQMKDNAGNLVNATLFNGNTDCTSPTTSNNESGAWHNETYTITLTPSDVKSGVKYTNWSIDGAANQTGTSVIISTEGNHSVLFYSADNVGNVEVVKTTYAALDTVTPTIVSTGVLNPDNFFSVVDKNVQIFANVTDTLNQTTLTVTANFSAISSTLNCGNGANAILNLSYNSGLGLYNGTCDISSAALSAATTPSPSTIVLTAMDSVPHIASPGTVTVLLENMDVPSMGASLCNRFGSQTTNFTEVTNFNAVNFIIQIEMNGSCISQNPWTGFQQVMKLNFTSLNMTSPDIGAKLGGLKDAIDVDILGPGEVGTNRIYINESAFAELNTNATITLSNLPFASLPEIEQDNASRTVSSASFTQTTPFNIGGILIPKGDLTFSVNGFSGYNATDSANPLISIISPNANVTSVSVNVTVNGTGSNPTNIQITGLGTTYYYNTSGNTAGCSNISADLETFRCVFSPGVADGPYTLAVAANDNSGEVLGGNTNSTSFTFIKDSTAPTWTISNPINGTNYYINQSIQLYVTATDSGVGMNKLTYNWNGTTNVTAGSSTLNVNVNYTTTGLKPIIFYANDSLNNLVTSTVYVNITSALPSTTFIANDTSYTVGANTTNILVPFNSSLQTVVSTNTTQAVSFDLSQMLSSGVVTVGSNNFTLITEGTYNYTAFIPSGINITGGASWDGKINLPTVNSSSFTAPSSGTTSIVIDMGSSVEVNFSSAVKVVIGGMAGKTAAWSRGSTTLTSISTVCNSVTAPTNIDAITTRECSVDSGSDLVIWTYHFTSFAAYTPETTSSRRGGGGSTTPVENITTVTPNCQTGWTCGAWSACTLNAQTRTCYKTISYCVADSVKPAETQSCAPDAAGTGAETGTARESIKEIVQKATVVAAKGKGFWTVAVVVLLVAAALYYFVPRKNWVKFN